MSAIRLAAAATRHKREQRGEGPVLAWVVQELGGLEALRLVERPPPPAPGEENDA